MKYVNKIELIGGHELSSSSSSSINISSENKDECESNIKLFSNTNIVDTIFPFITTQEQLENLLSTSLDIKPEPNYKPKYNTKKYKSKVYQNITKKSIIHTIKYIFNKMKTGVFVRIKDNKLINFIPLYNTNYKNDFAHLIKFKEGNVKKFIENKKKYNKRQAKINFDVSKWNATNCLLRNEFDDRFPTQAYLSEFYDLFKQTTENRKVNDCIFIVNRKDFPYLNKDFYESYEHIYGENVLMNEKWRSNSFVPILSQSTTSESADIPIITGGDDWENITQKYFVSGKDCRNDFITTSEILKWSDRKPIVFWRGQNTGCGNDISSNPRLHITKISAELKSKGINYLDAGVVNFTNRDKKILGKDFVEYYINKEKIEKVGFVNRTEQLKYKFCLNIEGNSAAYRYGSLFKMGFCVLNVESKYKLWFEPFLEEGIHFIEIKHDLSNLIEKIEWCLSHDKECERIAENGIEFYKKYFNYDFVYDYMSDCFNTISSMEA
jgi:hypothetical protein